ncbi:metallophosphoesterase [Aquimarina sp. 2201CG5-10]|uniref:metallophosphoesterase family protein n=1 Tax=Aquimarina callyspongiae TaxID=3098150 RepID=UPI002AB513D0|nr:metallophosphoesterase [Aquimarina sp. 2201CG5-10]MDY8138720.1 metallophosphoesterase [Aquimarina sp. 2201CG5-10]
MDTYNSPHLALWKSAAVSAIAKQQNGKNAKIDEEHPLLKAIDTYSEAMIKNEPLTEPKNPEDLQDDDPQILAYLTALNHQLAHAKISEDKDLEDQINEQRGRFRYGNPLWEEQQIEYFRYYWNYPFHKGQSPLYRSWQDKEFGNNNLNYGVIDWKIPADATIALIGDIGTGTDIAAGVLASALSFDPDVILHVGDIYYSGTPYEFETRFIGMIREVMKAHGKNVPVFTIPGNHEYFTGGIGFYDCIDTDMLINTKDQKQEASYFCLRTEDDYWQFLAMDTSFYGHYMDVPEKAQKAALELLHNNKVDIPSDPTNPHWSDAFNPIFHRVSNPYIKVEDTTHRTGMIPIRDDEQLWHKNKLETFDGRTILLSHHQVYSAKQHIGVAQTQIKDSNGISVPNPKDMNRAWINTELWKQFGAFMPKVAAWFWGHEHNLGIYKDNYRPDGWEDASGNLSTIPKGRCVGHSAIPVQEKEAPYEQKYPVPLIAENAKLDLTNGWYDRGYQILKLQGKDQPIKTSYYQIAEADPEPLLIFEEEIH